jgi:ubiquinone/menaquinone biosynthesis C-methylase UbiE
LSINRISNKNLDNFFKVLISSSFTKEEFLFNSIPYISGLKRILNITHCVVGSSTNNILDIGCGTGLTSYLLSLNSVHVEGIDIYDLESTQFHKNGRSDQEILWNNLTKFRKNLHFSFYNGSDLSYNNSQFNIVFLHAVLEHVSPSKITILLKEIYRVLKPGGFVIIARTPNNLALTEFLAKSHDCKFSKKQLLDFFKNYSYSIVHYELTDFFPEVGPTSFFQNLLNTMYPLTRILDNILNKTPLKLFSHHHFLILKSF